MATNVRRKTGATTKTMICDYAKRHQLSYDEAKVIVEDVLDMLFDTIYVHKSLSLRGYGRFDLLLRHYSATTKREGGETVSLRYEPSRTFKRKLNVMHEPHTHQKLRDAMIHIRDTAVVGESIH